MRKGRMLAKRTAINRLFAGQPPYDEAELRRNPPRKMLINAQYLRVSIAKGKLSRRVRRMAEKAIARELEKTIARELEKCLCP